MDLEGRVVPGPGTLLKQGIADGDGRGIDDVPVLHPAEGPRQIDLLCPCVGEGSVGQGRHARFAWFGVPAAITIARTHIPRCSWRWRSMTPHCWHQRSISSCGSHCSNTVRTSSPVMVYPPSWSLMA